jgi:hypothetical protein
MEELKKCIYCNEIMKYGPQTQVMCKIVSKDGNHISKSVKFVQYGWRCSMKDDNCDIVFDEKDSNKNKLISKQADKELLSSLKSLMV